MSAPTAADSGRSGKLFLLTSMIQKPMRGPAASFRVVEHTHQRPFTQYLSIATLGTVMVIVGAWLPWEHGHGRANTLEQVRPAVGPRTVEMAIFLFALVAGAAILTALIRRDWHPDLLFVSFAVLIISVAISMYNPPVEIGYWLNLLGLPMVLAGAGLLGLAGVFSYLLKRRLRQGRQKQGNKPIRSKLQSILHRRTREPNSADATGERGGSSNISYLVAISASASLVIVSGWPAWVPSGSNQRSTWFVGRGTLFEIPSTQLLVLPAIAVVLGAVVAVWYFDWRPDVWILAAAGFILFYSSNYIADIATDELLVVEPGWYLAFAGGLLMAGVALYSLWGRYAGDRGRVPAARMT